MVVVKDNDTSMADIRLPRFSIWGSDSDNVCLDVGRSTYHDLDDYQALGILRKLKYKLSSRLDSVTREIDRLEALNAPTEHKLKDHNNTMAMYKRWRENDYPRLLEIALHENGIKTND
mgnify:CR=1 FL=1